MWTHVHLWEYSAQPKRQAVKSKSLGEIQVRYSGTVASERNHPGRSGSHPNLVHSPLSEWTRVFQVTAGRVTLTGA